MASWHILRGVPTCIQPHKNATELLWETPKREPSTQPGKPAGCVGSPWAVSHPAPLPPQHCAVLQLQRDRDAHPRGEHGQQHRQPAPQSQRVQPASEPSADCELTGENPHGLIQDSTWGSCTDRHQPAACPTHCSSDVPAPLLSSSLLKVASSPSLKWHIAIATYGANLVRNLLFCTPL